MANQNPNPNLRFTKSKRGKDQAIFEGYLYTYDKNSKQNADLKANYSKGDENSCPARLHTQGNLVVMVQRDRHNHDEDPALIEAKIVRNVMKERAKNTVELPS